VARFTVFIFSETIKRMLVSFTFLTISKPFSQVLTSENLFRANLPQFVIVTFLDSQAFAVRLDKSPFTFQHFKVQRIRVSVDGHSSSFYGEVELDVDNNITLLAYNTLLKALPNQENLSVEKSFKLEVFL